MKLYIHFFLYALFAQLMFLVYANDAHAYLGPGAGLGLIGTLFAIIIVVLVVLFGLILYPIRRLKRKFSETPLEKSEENTVED